MRREIAIDKYGHKSSGKWGYVGEKDITHLMIELPDELVPCDLIKAKIISAGEEFTTDKLNLVDGKVDVSIPLSCTVSAGKITAQIIGYVVDESDEIYSIGKTAVFAGVISPSSKGKPTTDTAQIPLLERIWVKIQAWADKIHTHVNQKILDNFHCIAFENPFYIGMNANDLTWMGGAIRFREDGAVIRDQKEIERDGKKYLRLYLHWQNGKSLEWQKDFIDIPITGIAQVEEEKPGSDLILNGGALELPTGGDNLVTREEWDAQIADYDDRISFNTTLIEAALKVCTQSTDTTAVLLSDRHYDFGVAESLTLDFDVVDELEVYRNEYSFTFVSGETPTVLTMPDDVVWANGNVPTIQPNATYIVTIVDNIASYVTTAEVESGVTQTEMQEYVTAAINGSLDEIEAMIDESGVLDE